MSRDIRYFGPHREPAVLVEDFGELREGMVIWRAACPACGRDHRAMISAVTASEICRAGEPTFDHLPKSSCGFGSLCRCSIINQQVFAVIDEPPARGRKLETA